MHSSVQGDEIALEVLPVVGPRDAVDAGRGLALERLVRVAESLDRHVVKERRESLLLIPRCCFAHTVERTLRVYPALSPGRVLLSHVPRRCAPSLHPLLRSGTSVVRRLRRYYERI